jgi:sugar phosphate isomerase/epimerase
MTRRELLATAALFSRRLAAAAPVPNRLGGAPAAFALHIRAARDAHQPYDILDICQDFGLGGVETRLPSLDTDEVFRFRKKLEAYGMRVILTPPLPKTEAEVPRFDTEVKAAADAGAYSLHAALTGRRFEEFARFEDFRAAFERHQKSILLAEPVLRKYRVRLGIENQGGWRSAEQAAWIKRLGSEWVGVHFDFGNNLVLCEDPEETFQNLAPMAVACHLKDVAVASYEEGFLVSEVPLGDGILDLWRWMGKLRQINPNMVFDLESATAEPVRVPVFNPKYWATFDDAASPLPGRDLAAVLGVVRKNVPKRPLTHLAGMSIAQQAELEDANNHKSIEYAQKNLELK